MHRKISDMIRTKFFILLGLAMFSLTALGQIDNQIITILEHCDKVMHNPAGTEISMSLNIKAMVVFSSSGTMTTYSKGEKSFTKAKMKILGKDITTYNGSDGKEDWMYRPAILDGENDTIYISKSDSSPKKDDYINLNIHKQYSVGKMKELDNYYEISFSKPKDKDFPKKTTLKINKKDYSLKEMSMKDTSFSMKLTITRIKFGVSDDVVTFNPKKFPGAKIIRR